MSFFKSAKGHNLGWLRNWSFPTFLWWLCTHWLEALLCSS